MKRFFAMATLALSMYAVAPAASAQSYVGSWRFGNDGSEYLYLGDNSDGTFRFLRGASGYCSQPGASYSRMRQILRNQGGDIFWWEDATCDDGVRDYVRICLENDYGQSACSTYRDMGWQW